VALAAACLIFTMSASRATAQTATPTPTPKSAEVLRLEEEKAQADLRKGIAEANKAELEAQFPKPTSSPLEGKTTISDGAVIESQMISYVALARAANKLVSAINHNSDVMRKVKDENGNDVVKSNVGKLAIFNEDDVKLLLSYKTSMGQIKILRQSYCNLLAKSQTTKELCPDVRQGSRFGNQEAVSDFIPAVSIARSVLGSFVDLTSLLRTNVEIKGQTFEIEEAALAAEVFRAGRRTDGSGFLSSASMFYPKIFAPDLNPDKQYEILGLLDIVQELRNKAGRLIARLEKNTEDLKKAETKLETQTNAAEQLDASLKTTLEKLRIVLAAHCPRMPYEQREDVYGMESRLAARCPFVPGEQRERILELVSEIKKLDAQLTTAKTNIENTKKAVDALKIEREHLWAQFQGDKEGETKPIALSVEDKAGQLKARNEQVDKLIAALVQPGTGGSVNALTSYIKAENLLDALTPSPASPGSQSYWLQLKVVKAGGNNRIKTNLLWDIFTGGNRVSHSGGVIVQYLLFNNGGEVIASDTITEYTDYIKSKKVKNLPRLASQNPSGASEVDDQ
jgi:hypothetical protein